MGQLELTGLNMDVRIIRVNTSREQATDDFPASVGGG
jgi:hypothetical protein